MNTKEPKTPIEITTNTTDVINIKEYDYINPSHYTKYTFEVIEMMEKVYGAEWTAIYCELTIMKYRLRMGDKPNEPVERDMKKVKWYETKLKELREKLK